MALLYSDLLDVMAQRAERLGLTPPGQAKADTAELELYIFQALLDLAELVDVPAYMVYNAMIVTTTAGNPDYEVPTDFGRLILPRAQNRRGLSLFDMRRRTPLEYVDPPTLKSRTAPRNDTPKQFTLVGRTLSVYPPPDAPASGHYTIEGFYMTTVTRPELTDTVLISYPTALVDQALFRLATDMSKPVQGLQATRQEALARLVGGSR